MKKAIEITYKKYVLMATIMKVGTGWVPLSYHVYLNNIKVNNHVGPKLAERIEGYLREYCKEMDCDNT